MCIRQQGMRVASEWTCLDSSRSARRLWDVVESKISLAVEAYSSHNGQVLLEIAFDWCLEHDGREVVVRCDCAVSGTSIDCLSSTNDERLRMAAG